MKNAKHAITVLSGRRAAICFAPDFFSLTSSDCHSLFTKWIHTVYNDDANRAEEYLTFRPGTKQTRIVHTELGRLRGANKHAQTAIFVYTELSVLLTRVYVCMYMHLSLSLSWLPILSITLPLSFPPSSFLWIIYSNHVVKLLLPLHTSHTVAVSLRQIIRMPEKGAVKIKGARCHSPGLVCGR